MSAPANRSMVLSVAPFVSCAGRGRGLMKVLLASGTQDDVDYSMVLVGTAKNNRHAFWGCYRRRQRLQPHRTQLTNTRARPDHSRTRPDSHPLSALDSQAPPPRLSTHPWLPAFPPILCAPSLWRSEPFFFSPPPPPFPRSKAIIRPGHYVLLCSA